MKPIIIIYLLCLSVVDAQKMPFGCPTPGEIQSSYVKESFDFQKMNGFWYELAMKDITQPRYCKCQTSEKLVNISTGIILDNFTIECFGKPYVSYLSFHLTEQAGVNIGTWTGKPLVSKIKFPNTIVDVGVNTASGEYDWMIEFQCIPSKRRIGSMLRGGDGIRFAAMNFYSKQYKLMDDRIKDMEQIARLRGFSRFFDTGLPMTIINHTDCVRGH